MILEVLDNFLPFGLFALDDSLMVLLECLVLVLVFSSKDFILAQNKLCALGLLLLDQVMLIL